MTLEVGNQALVQAGNPAVTPLHEEEDQVVPALNQLIAARIAEPNGLVDILSTLGNELISSNRLVKAMGQQITGLRTENRQMEAQMELIAQEKDLNAQRVADVAAQVGILGQENAVHRDQIEQLSKDNQKLIRQNVEVIRQLEAQQRQTQLHANLSRLENQLSKLNHETEFNEYGAALGVIGGGFWGTLLGGPVGGVVGSVAVGAMTGCFPGDEQRRLLAPQINALNREIQETKEKLHQELNSC